MATSTRASKKDQRTTLLFVLSLTVGEMRNGGGGGERRTWLNTEFWKTLSTRFHLELHFPQCSSRWSWGTNFFIYILWCPMASKNTCHFSNWYIIIHAQSSLGPVVVLQVASEERGGHLLPLCILSRTSMYSCSCFTAVMATASSLIISSNLFWWAVGRSKDILVHKTQITALTSHTSWGPLKRGTSVGFIEQLEWN